MSYRRFQAQLMPTALQDAYGQSYARALGIVKDYLLQQGRASVQQRFPDYAYPDALGAIGDERSIDQGNDAQLVTPETNAAYAGRLRDAWNAWLKGGTAWGLLTALAAQGYTGAIIRQQNGLQFTLSGGNVVITQLSPLTLQTRVSKWGQGFWGQGVWGGSTPWNIFLLYFPSVPSSWTNIKNPPTAASSPSLSEVQKLRRIINLWKPAWAFCAGIGVVTSGGGPPFWGVGSWGTGTWGSSVVWFSGSNTPTWGYPIGQKWGAGNLPGAWNAQV